MMTAHALRCIDLLLREIMTTEIIFGGKRKYDIRRPNKHNQWLLNIGNGSTGLISGYSIESVLIPNEMICRDVVNKIYDGDQNLKTYLSSDSVISGNEYDIINYT
ncbi:hypothetical protein BB558_006910, partial [Smittium angustum]